MARFKCSDEDYAYLQRLRNQLISFKIDYRGLEETRDYSLRAKCFDTAELLSGVMKRRVEEMSPINATIKPNGATTNNPSHPRITRKSSVTSSLNENVTNCCEKC